jgi:hypothetical protein
MNNTYCLIKIQSSFLKTWISLYFIRDTEKYIGVIISKKFSEFTQKQAFSGEKRPKIVKNSQ